MSFRGAGCGRAPLAWALELWVEDPAAILHPCLASWNDGAASVVEAEVAARAMVACKPAERTEVDAAVAVEEPEAGAEEAAEDDADESAV
jgi:hypothetical protein